MRADSNSGLDFVRSLEDEWKGIGHLTLDHIRELMLELGSPQDRVKCVHVAGTNGKGSVSAAISSILAASGVSVGMTISPHLSKVNERIVINGRMITDADFGLCAHKVALACAKIGRKPSFFEAITAIAFVAFEHLKVEWAVLEVGLGGRLDATNVIKRPECAAIVTIDYDHQHVLGDTLAQIATEKAGIIKEGGMVVLGGMQQEAILAIEAIAAQKQARLVKYGTDFSVEEGSYGEPGYRFIHKGGGGSHFCPSLLGDHQVHNMTVAFAVASELGIAPEICAKGIQSVFWPARLEKLKLVGADLLIDCAHNPAGMDQLTNYLKQQNLYQNTIVFGALQTKDWKLMLEKLIPYATNWVLAKPDSGRAVEPVDIAAYLSGFGINSKIAEANYDLLAENLKSGTLGNNVLLCGSMYLIGRIRPLLREDNALSL